MSTKRILVVEDHSIVRDAMKDYLSEIYPESVIDFCLSVNEGVALLAENKYTFVISDLGFENRKRFEIVELAGRLRIPCIVFTGFCHGVFLKRALEIGISGYVVKTSPITELGKAIENIGKCTPYLCPQAASLCIDEVYAEQSQAPRLNYMEEVILRYTLEGKTQEEIAQQLGKSHHLIRHYRREMIKNNNCSFSVLIRRYVEWNH